jgi:deoxyxylulose-5-phosphate synthase
MTNFLDAINYPQDLKKLNPEDLPFLAQELRNFIIKIVLDYPYTDNTIYNKSKMANCR